MRAARRGGRAGARVSRAGVAALRRARFVRGRRAPRPRSVDWQLDSAACAAGATSPSRCAVRLEEASAAAAVLRGDRGLRRRASTPRVGAGVMDHGAPSRAHVDFPLRFGAPPGGLASLAAGPASRSRGFSGATAAGSVFRRGQFYSWTPVAASCALGPGLRSAAALTQMVGPDRRRCGGLIGALPPSPPPVPCA